MRAKIFQQFSAEFPSLQSILLTDLYRERQRAYFSGKTIEQLRAVTAVHEQLSILATLFYFPPQVNSCSTGIWKYGHYISYKNHEQAQDQYPFFREAFCFLNAERYPYKGKDSRVMGVTNYLAIQGDPDPDQGIELLLTGLLAEVN